MNFKGLSDSQVREFGVRYWGKANKSQGSVAKDYFIRQGMACQLELERRHNWRKLG